VAGGPAGGRSEAGARRLGADPPDAYTLTGDQCAAWAAHS